MDQQDFDQWPPELSQMRFGIPREVIEAERARAGELVAAGGTSEPHAEREGYTWTAQEILAREG